MMSILLLHTRNEARREREREREREGEKRRERERKRKRREEKREKERDQRGMSMPKSKRKCAGNSATQTYLACPPFAHRASASMQLSIECAAARVESAAVLP